MLQREELGDVERVRLGKWWDEQEKEEEKQGEEEEEVKREEEEEVQEETKMEGEVGDLIGMEWQGQGLELC